LGFCQVRGYALYATGWQFSLRGNALIKVFLDPFEAVVSLNALLCLSLALRRRSFERGQLS
jgi:hypothetical protein